MAVALLFFSFTNKKNNQLKRKNKCATSAVGTKTMTKKVGALQAKSVIAFVRWQGGILFSSQKEKDLFFTASFLRFIIATDAVY